MQKKGKPYTTVDQQISILQGRGMVIPDVEDAKRKLSRNNYYTIINGYKTPFLQEREDGEERYIDGVSFDEIFALYEFDCQLRAILLKYILMAEHQLKSVISHRFASMHQTECYPGYLKKENFVIQDSPMREKKYKDLIDHVEKEYEHQKKNNNEMILHSEEVYGDVPPWILVSILSFGTIRTLFDLLGNKDQNEIGRAFGIHPGQLKQDLSALNTYRNACAHDERIYNLILKNQVTRTKDKKKVTYNKVFVVFLILKDMLESAAFVGLHTELDAILKELGEKLNSIEVEKIYNAMGLPADEATRKDVLGPLERGDGLDLEEFQYVLTSYVLPTLSVSGELRPIGDREELRNNPGCRLIEKREDFLLFSQSTTGNFSFCLPLQGQNVTKDQFEAAREHLVSLIDYLHVFWNLKGKPQYRGDHMRLTFPAVCEQAYELTLCKLLCRDTSVELRKKYGEAQAQLRRESGGLSKEQRQMRREALSEKKRQLDQALEREEQAEKSLYGILVQLETWATKTYEGQKKSFGIILDRENVSGERDAFNYIEFLKSDYSATINDGCYSAVELYADGTFKAHMSIGQIADPCLPTIPYPFSGFAQLCEKGKVGILLTHNEDILIVSDKKLRYTKHNGHWVRSMASQVICELVNRIKLERERADIIYQTLTDVAFSRGGACIGIIEEDELPPKLEEKLAAGILSEEKEDQKLTAIREMILADAGMEQKSFYELDRHLRRELLELDGAMVFSKSGHIHVVGTIIKLDASGSDGGGRTAAAKQLSEYGLGIKISQDGYIQMFQEQKEFLKAGI